MISAFLTLNGAVYAHPWALSFVYPAFGGWTGKWGVGLRTTLRTKIARIHKLRPSFLCYFVQSGKFGSRLENSGGLIMTKRFSPATVLSKLQIASSQPSPRPTSLRSFQVYRSRIPDSAVDLPSHYVS